jgi:hypothetical protein
MPGFSRTVTLSPNQMVEAQLFRLAIRPELLETFRRVFLPNYRRVCNNNPISI